MQVIYKHSIFKCSSLFKADLFHSLLHFGFNESPHQCNPGSLLLVDFGILGFGFWNLTLGFRNSAQESVIPQQLESVIQVQLTRNPESSMWSPEFTAWIQDQRLSWITLYGAKWAKHSSWDAYSAAHAPDRVDFKSVYSCVRNHSLLKEGNVLVNPPNSNANMLLSAYSYFD